MHNHSYQVSINSASSSEQNTQIDYTRQKRKEEEN